MNTQPQPAPVLAWHNEAALEIRRYFGKPLLDICETDPVLPCILAKHDPHAETVRLLEEVIKAGDVIAAHFDPGPIPAPEPTQSDLDFGHWEYVSRLIRTRLAKLKGTL